MNELKPCPFCGNSARFGLTGSGWFVSCDVCGGCMGTPGSGYHSQEQAAGEWNRRQGWVPIENQAIDLCGCTMPREKYVKVGIDGYLLLAERYSIAAGYLPSDVRLCRLQPRQTDAPGEDVV